MSNMPPYNEAIVPVIVALINNGILDNPDKIDDNLKIIEKLYDKIKDIINQKKVD